MTLHSTPGKLKSFLRLEPSWEKVLESFVTSPAWSELLTKVHHCYNTQEVFPPARDVFRAYTLCPFHNTKVVIVGQDPYHDFYQAHGLSFSVPEEIPAPPTLHNIFKELRTDTHSTRTNTDLTDWAEQGVLLLNSVLTVQAHKAASHTTLGWQQLTDETIKVLSEKENNIVFMLWGNYAKTKIPFIDETKHLIIQSSHPSPLSAHAGFFGSKPFSKTNSYLKKHGIDPIDW
ncbi:MAG: uracil-DNA glycosylase [Alphaproteobacteria bacterium]|nr:uracil-DNA glycosylase [Alphaproteobacteria bacterium]